MQLHKTLIPIVAVAVLLSACDEKGGGAAKGGVGVENTTSTEAKEGSASTRSKDESLETSQAQKASTSMPAHRVIADAILKITAEGKIDPEKARRDFTKPGFGKALERMNDDEARKFLTGVIASVVFAPTYWPSGTVSSFGDISKSGLLFTKHFTAASLFTDQVFAVLASKVGKTTLKDPVAAREKIVTSLKDIPVDGLKAMFASALEEADMSDKIKNNVFVGSGGGLKWMIGAYEVAASSAGTVVASSGAPLFGNGYIHGKELKIALELSVGTTLTETKGVSSDSTTGTSSSSSQSAKLGN